MTENEALKRMKMCIGISPSENIVNSFKLISDALEEVQQYRVIGTQEEFKALKEKNEPKKPIFMRNLSDTVSAWECKKCGVHFKTMHEAGILKGTEVNFCSKCGCEFDWSEGE